VFESEPDGLHRLIEHLREPIEMDPALDGRVMARVARPAAKTTVITDVWTWLRRPWQLSISPLSIAAVGGILLAAWLGVRQLHHPPTAMPSGETEVQFVVVAPTATRVSLVGDFNDWDASRTPMQASQTGGIWSVTIPLSPGRHRYAYLVNGKVWMADPASPRAQDDFGTPSSVVTVGG
jgi:hypothetical protein